MKTLSPITKLTLTAAIGTLVLTGCSTTGNTQYGDAGEMPQSALSFTPVTDPVELTKWSNDFDITSIERYSFQAPETFEMADLDMNLTADADSDTLEFNEDLEPGAEFREAAGSAPASRQVWHAPHQR